MDLYVFVRTRMPSIELEKPLAATDICFEKVSLILLAKSLKKATAYRNGDVALNLSHPVLHRTDHLRHRAAERCSEIRRIPADHRRQSKPRCNLGRLLRELVARERHVPLLDTGSPGVILICVLPVANALLPLSHPNLSESPVVGACASEHRRAERCGVVVFLALRSSHDPHALVVPAKVLHLDGDT